MGRKLVLLVPMSLGEVEEVLMGELGTDLRRTWVLALLLVAAALMAPPPVLLVPAPVAVQRRLQLLASVVLVLAHLLAMRSDAARQSEQHACGQRATELQ